MRKYSCMLMLLSVSAIAQTPVDDFFYSSGKIYVVVAILVITFIGLALYMRRLDKEITKIENQKNEA